jgi:NADPH:quinone reductase-like Zn-dependent oxidoreductase
MVPAATLFIYGGSTAMGIAGLQFAKASGAKVITTSSPQNAEYLYSLGADHVLDYSSPTIIDEVKEITKGELLTLAWDCRPTEQGARICASILSREGGRYVTLLPQTQAIVEELNPKVETFFTAAYTVFGEPWFFLGYHDPVPADHEFMKTFVTISEDLMREGKIKAPRIFLNRGGKGLTGVLKGIQEMVEGNVSGGKLVYTRE